MLLPSPYIDWLPPGVLSLTFNLHKVELLMLQSKRTVKHDHFLSIF